jgi:hypothetical protein
LLWLWLNGTSSSSCSILATIKHIIVEYRMTNRANVAVTLQGPSRKCLGTKSNDPKRLLSRNGKFHGLVGLTRSVITENGRQNGGVVSGFDFDSAVAAKLESAWCCFISGDPLPYSMI